MKAKHQNTLQRIFSRPTPAGVKWLDVIALFEALGAGISEAEGSRVSIVLFGQVRVMHRPHPRPEVDKGAVAAIRKWLDENGVNVKLE